VRVNSAGNGESAPYEPYSLTIADTLSSIKGNHYVKVGGDVRIIRMVTDQVGGITYTYQNVGNFLNNIPQQIQYFGDLSEPSPFHNGATGLKHTEQNYYVGFAQDEWRVSSKVTFNYGLRYDYYTPMKERDNRIVKFNIDNGALDPDTTPLFSTKKNSFQPRVSSTYAMTDKTVLRGGFGVFVGPGQTEDQIQPIEAERISTTATSGALLLYPVDENAIRANFTSNPNNRSYQPRAYSNDYTLPERVLPVHRVHSAGAAGCDGGDDRVRRQPGSEPVPPQHREPDRRRAALGHGTPRVRPHHVRERCRSGWAHHAEHRVEHLRGVHGRQQAVTLRRSRLQDQRRSRQLQRAADRAAEAVVKRPGAERSVHAWLQQGEHRRIERSHDREQQRPRAG
jgi:hypothetical protein